MKLAITGSPGVGKTSVAKQLGKILKIPVLNEKEFALKKGIADWNEEENELEIDQKKLKLCLEKELSKLKNLIIEGHILCEIKLDIDAVIVLRLDPELLEQRLAKRSYLPEKVMDNVFCEGIDYCKKHVKRRYPEKKVIEIESKKGIKETTLLIIKELKRRGIM